MDCDVARSLWGFTEGWSEEERGVKRDELRRMLNGVVLAHAGVFLFLFFPLSSLQSLVITTSPEGESERSLAKPSYGKQSLNVAQRAR